MADPLFSQQFRAIPKVELHRHLDCSMRWSTFTELAPQCGLEWPSTPLEQRSKYLIHQPMKDLQSVLQKFLSSQKVLASEEILTRLAFEVCEDAYNEGIYWLELRYAPTFIVEGHHNLTFESIHLSLLKGVEMAMAKYPLAVGLIAIIQRVKSLQLAQRVCDFAIDHKESFIALDLADNEDGFEPKPFAPLFEKAKKHGLHITIHSGETPDSRAPLWIKDSIELLGAERIGHGVQVIRSPEMMTYLKEKQIPLEVCPISNWLTQAFPDFSTHPARKLYDFGIPITINADDPGIFATTVNDDYEVLHRYHDFSLEDFRICNQTALKHSFLSDELKKRPLSFFNRQKSSQKRSHHA
jgi:adenosine deaminase